MLLTNLDDVEPGMKVAVVVLHPRRPEMQLLAADTQLDRPMIHRLRQLGVSELWIHHDALADLDAHISPRLPMLRQQVYAHIKNDFAHMSATTVTTTQVQSYRKAIIELVLELVGNLKVAGLTDMLFTTGETIFSHCANVAYLATLIGLELETYIISERKRLALDHARDLTALGLGAMLHDLGKVTLPTDLRTMHETHWKRSDQPMNPDLYKNYQQHVVAGYRMLADSHAPASARQIVLNHHQRFDGQGWPDLKELTRKRRIGPQVGRDIHIFSRIVAAANVLESLLRDAQGRRRPPVAALHDFYSDRFDGWFDPVIRAAMLRKLPPFAMGTKVTLSDGRSGAVVAPNINQPCRPVVRVLTDKQGRELVDALPTVVLEERGDLRIVASAGVEVERFLFELPPLPRSQTKSA